MAWHAHCLCGCRQAGQSGFAPEVSGAARAAGGGGKAGSRSRAGGLAAAAAAAALGGKGAATREAAAAAAAAIAAAPSGPLKKSSAARRFAAVKLAAAKLAAGAGAATAKPGANGRERDADADDDDVAPPAKHPRRGGGNAGADVADCSSNVGSTSGGAEGSGGGGSTSGGVGAGMLSQACLERAPQEALDAFDFANPPRSRVLVCAQVRRVGRPALAGLHPRVESRHLSRMACLCTVLKRVHAHTHTHTHTHAPSSAGWSTVCTICSQGIPLHHVHYPLLFLVLFDSHPQSNAAIDELLTRLVGEGVWRADGARRPPAVVRLGRVEVSEAPGVGPQGQGRRAGVAAGAAETQTAPTHTPRPQHP